MVIRVFAALRRIALVALLFGLLTIGAASGAAPKRTLTVSADGEGTLSSDDGKIDCGMQCAAAYPHGRVVTVTESPSSAFEFHRWIEGCVGTSPSCAVTLDHATTVRAEFGRIPQDVSITVGGPGVVVSSPIGLQCGKLLRDACTASFGQGQMIRLTPFATPDGTFVRWGGRCLNAPLDGCDLTVGVADEVTATFRHAAPASGMDKVTLVGGKDQPGLTCPKLRCTGMFPADAPLTLVGSQEWDGDCVGVGSECTVVPDEPLEIQNYQTAAAQHAQGGVGVNVSVSGRGFVTGARIRCGQRQGTLGDCETFVVPGDPVLLKASPAKRFVSWGGFCKGHRPTCPMHVLAAETVQAVFRH